MQSTANAAGDTKKANVDSMDKAIHTQAWDIVRERKIDGGRKIEKEKSSKL